MNIRPSESKQRSGFQVGKLNQPQDLLGTTPTTSVGGWWGRVELVWVLGSGALGGHFA